MGNAFYPFLLEDDAGGKMTAFVVIAVIVVAITIFCLHDRIDYSKPNSPAFKKAVYRTLNKRRAEEKKQREQEEKFLVKQGKQGV